MEGFKDNIRMLIKFIELKPYLYFQYPKFNIFYLNYFLMGIQQAQLTIGEEHARYNFEEIKEFNFFIEKKYELNHEVPNSWWVNIMHKFDTEEEQNREFFSLWNEFVKQKDIT